MTNAAVKPDLPIRLSAKDRNVILENILKALHKRFYSPEKLNADWQAAVERHRPLIEGAANAEAFEQAMSDLLAELHTSHLGFFHRSARRASSRAALSATYLADDTPYGKRWIFQDVHSGGAASIAGIVPGDILFSVDSRDITPPEHPAFSMGKQTILEIVGRDERRHTVPVDVARPKEKKLHFIQPRLVEARLVDDRLGYLKFAMFPGLIGVEVANAISGAVETLGAVKSLIIDLRGNTGVHLVSTIFFEAPQACTVRSEWVFPISRGLLLKVPELFGSDLPFRSLAGGLLPNRPELPNASGDLHRLSRPGLETGR